MGSQLLVLDGGVAGLLACAAAGDSASYGFVAPVGGSPDTSLLRRQAAERQAALYGLEIAGATDPKTENEARVLLVHACLAAVERGAGSVIWPVNAGDELDLDRTTTVVDRALLAGRLVSVGGAAVEVRTPYVDFTDRQLADLILDMDLPIWTCWWYDGAANPAAEQERRRWGALLRSAGWAGDLPGPELTVRSGPLGPAAAASTPSRGSSAGGRSRG